VGGGAIVTIPALILLGLPPHVAIGTNRFGATGFFMAGSYQFHRKKMINYKIALTVGIPALFGSVLGAHLVLQINEAVLKKVIAFLTIVILLFIMARPQMGIEKSKQTVKHHVYVIGAAIGFFLGTYQAFYGAAVGTFVSYVLILLFGLTFLESAATRQLVNLLPSMTALIIFAANGVINYPLGIALFVGSATGSYFGVRYSTRIGNVWIRRLFLVVVILMAIKLLM